MMEDKDLKLLCADSITITKGVGEFLMGELGKVGKNQIQEKDLNSLVSYVDKTAELKLVEGLSKLIPGSSFLTEEGTIEQTTGTYRWIIDPLDGTTNFLHQLPYFAISVALEKEGKILMGIVFDPTRKDCFFAWKNGGAYLNEHTIAVSKTGKLQQSLISTGFPYHDFEREKDYFNAFNFLMKNTRGIRRFGAAALDMAYVACGRYDAFFEYGLNAWDVAAGSLIVSEAGGLVCDFKGGSGFLFGREMIAANKNISSSIIGTIKGAFSVII